MSSHLLELRSSLPLDTPRGKGRCLFLLDAAEDQESLFLVALDESGELWWFRQRDVRLRPNTTFGTRQPATPRMECKDPSR